MLFGDAGPRRDHGGPGDDTLLGGAGNDRISGGAGRRHDRRRRRATTRSTRATARVDHISCGPGRDRVHRRPAATRSAGDCEVVRAWMTRRRAGAASSCSSTTTPRSAARSTAGLELEGFRVVPRLGRPRGARGGRARAARRSMLLDLDDARPRRPRGAAPPARARRPGAGVRALGPRRGRRPRARPAGRRRRLRRQAVRDARRSSRVCTRCCAGARPPRARRLAAGDMRARPARRAPRGAAGATSTSRAASSSCSSSSCATPARSSTGARLHEEVWGYTFDPGTNVADVFVGYLRRKLEADGEPRVLHTVRGVGFVLRP